MVRNLLSLFSVILFVEVLACSQPRTSDSQQVQPEQGTGKVSASATPTQAQKYPLQVRMGEKSGIVVSVQELAHPTNVYARFETVSRLPKGEYQDWMTKPGSLFGEQVVRVPEDAADKTLAEVLVIFRNQGRSHETVSLDIFGLLLGDKLTKPYELMPGAVYGTYEELVKKFSLDGKPAELFLKFNFAGTAYCELAPGQASWVVADFWVPKDQRTASLLFGGHAPAKVELPLR